MSILCNRLFGMTALALALLLGSIPGAQAELRNQNIVQLIESSQSIVGGTVTEVTDGIDANGVPYTEVTIKVGINLKGGIEKGEYTFRQFGLLEPRSMPNGHRMLAMTPSEFPQWRVNEYVVAFLYHPAARTGLQTTVGLGQGKFTKVNDELSNRFDNIGLFRDVEVSAGILPQAELNLLQSSGPVDAAAFMDLVRHVVKDDLIGKGAIK